MKGGCCTNERVPANCETQADTDEACGPEETQRVVRLEGPRRGHAAWAKTRRLNGESPTRPRVDCRIEPKSRWGRLDCRDARRWRRARPRAERQGIASCAAPNACQCVNLGASAGGETECRYEHEHCTREHILAIPSRARVVSTPRVEWKDSNKSLRRQPKTFTLRPLSVPTSARQRGRAGRKHASATGWRSWTEFLRFLSQRIHRGFSNALASRDICFENLLALYFEP